MADNTALQLLRDPDIQPTDAIIAAGLGGASGTFNKFVDELREIGITLMDWRYYNDGKAWLSKGEYKWTTPRGANKVVPIFWLSIWEGFFRVVFFFGYAMKEELLSLPISPQAKEIISNTAPMGKKVLSLPVVLEISSDDQLADVYELAELRKVKMK